jgi:hypothetical protein
MRRETLVILSIVALILALATVALAADPNVGTWKLNVAKSNFNPGPAPKSLIQTITALDNGIKVVTDSVNAEGKAFHIENSSIYDGKDYPITGNPTADAVSVTRVDANTSDWAAKMKGKVVGSPSRAVVSKDGKTRTLTSKGKNPQGEDFTVTLVFDKQ